MQNFGKRRETPCLTNTKINLNLLRGTCGSSLVRLSGVNMYEKQTHMPELSLWKSLVELVLINGCRLIFPSLPEDNFIMEFQRRIIFRCSMIKCISSLKGYFVSCKISLPLQNMQRITERGVQEKLWLPRYSKCLHFLFLKIFLKFIFNIIYQIG